MSFIITDNAANMKKAFAVTFPDHESAAFDDEDIWEDVETSADLGYERLSCFAHSLQLVIADGLKHSRVMSSALAKVSRLATLLHSSTSLKVCRKLRRVWDVRVIWLWVGSSNWVYFAAPGRTSNHASIYGSHCCLLLLEWYRRHLKGSSRIDLGYHSPTPQGGTLC